LRSDNGGEFTSKEFMDFCSEHGIKRQVLSSQDTSTKWSCRKEEQNNTGNGQNHVERFQVEGHILGTGSTYNKFISRIEECSEITVIKLPMSYGKEYQQM
jgi:hypothetical protein